MRHAAAVLALLLASATVTRAETTEPTPSSIRFDAQTAGTYAERERAAEQQLAYRGAQGKAYGDALALGAVVVGLLIVAVIVVVVVLV
jgi:hypothetical protein